MTDVPLAARIVEVIADRGELGHPRYRWGSGCVVRGRTVLTAAHVVAGAQAVQVRDPNKILHPATLDPRFVGDPAGPGPDLALVDIESTADAAAELGAIQLAVVDRDSPAAEVVERCHAIGYPQFAERRASGAGRIADILRDTADAYGHVLVLSKLASGLLTLQVTSAPRPLPQSGASLEDSPWSGMSGAPVVADGCLIGVVSEHALREGPSAITVTPVTALDAKPLHPGWGPGVTDAAEWWAKLGVDRPDALRRLPHRRGHPRPAYSATVTEIHARTGQLIGRQQELASLVSFARGPAGYLWLTGGPWTGKTALLAEAVTAALPDSVDVLCYFLSRREAEADSNHFLAAVVPQLAYLLDEDPPVPDVHQFRSLWQRVAEAAEAPSRHLLLVVDGLDEDLCPDGVPPVAAFLPSLLGGNAHVILSSRPHTELPVPVGHWLGTHQPVKMELAPFSGAAGFAGTAERAALARQEVDYLVHRDGGVAVDILGLLTAAAGPLAVEDLAKLTAESDPIPLSHIRSVRRFLRVEAARSLQEVGPETGRRYQFAHASLLEYAQGEENLRDPEYRRRIHQWADEWQMTGWPVGAESAAAPRYLLDAYPATLSDDPSRLASLVSDVGWVDNAIRVVGVDAVLASLRTALAATPAHRGVAAMLAAVAAQAHHLRLPEPPGDPGFRLRQLSLQAAELGEDDLAAAAQERLRDLASPGLVPLWTIRRSSRALIEERGLGGAAAVMASMADGRLATGDSHGTVRVVDPAAPAAQPIDLGRNQDTVRAIAGMPDGRVVTGDMAGCIRVWGPAADAATLEVGCADSIVEAVAGLPDGRVVTGHGDGLVCVWSLDEPPADPVRLGSHNVFVRTVAVLPSGLVATGDGTGMVAVWSVPEAGVESMESDSAERMEQDDISPMTQYNGTAAALAALPARVVEGLAGLPDGMLIISVEPDEEGDLNNRLGQCQLWAWDLADPEAELVRLGHRHDHAVRAIAAMPSGQVITGDTGGWVRIWDPATPEAGPVVLGRHDAAVLAVGISVDGQPISGDPTRVRVWDPALAGTGTGEQSDEAEVGEVAMLPGGRAVTGGPQLRVWDPAGPGTPPVRLGRQDEYGVTAIAVLADGRVVNGTGDGRVRVWDPAGPGTEPVEVGSSGVLVLGLAVLPDGRVVTGDVQGRVRAWDPASPGAGPVDVGDNHVNVRALTALADGRVVTGDTDGRVRVWEPTAPGAEPVEVGSSGAMILCMAVLPDARVVTGDYDGRMHVWNPAAPGTEPVQVGRHDGPVQAMAVLPDGRVISGGDDARLCLWDVNGRVGRTVGLFPVAGVAATAFGPGEIRLAVSHGIGLSMWSFAAASS